MSQDTIGDLRRMRTGLGWVLFGLRLLIIPYLLVTIAGIALAGRDFYRWPLGTLMIPGPLLRSAVTERYWPVIIAVGLQLLCLLLAALGKMICFTRIDDRPTRGLVLASIGCDLVMIAIEATVVLPEMFGRPILPARTAAPLGWLARLIAILGLWLWLDFTARLATYLSRQGPAEHARSIQHTILALGFVFIGLVVISPMLLEHVRAARDETASPARALPAVSQQLLAELLFVWLCLFLMLVISFVIWVRTQLLHKRLRTALHDAELLERRNPILI